MAGQMYDDGSKKPIGSNLYSKMRGVVDFSNLSQFNLFETGYGIFGVINGPDFMKQRADHKALLDTFIAAIENEFANIDGFEDLEGETSDITDNISTLRMITKVTEASASTVTTSYSEKTGRIITKTIELFLRGLKDTRTQAKTYNGVASTSYRPEFSKEVFNHIFINTDNTYLLAENAYLLLNAQPNKVPLGNMFNYEKGNIEFVKVDVEWNCFPIRSTRVNRLAQQYLDVLSTVMVRDSTDFDWSISNGSADSSGKVGNISQIKFNPTGDNVKSNM